MGLDMYLRKETYVSAYDFDNKQYSEPRKVNVRLEFEYNDGHKKLITIDETIASSGGVHLQLPFCYWRKANAIHKWFVDLSGREDDCRPIYVSGRKIQELVSLCKKVLRNHDKAGELLPTQYGFFFVDTNYDEYYFQDLQYTVDKLKDVDERDEFIYQASW